MSDLADRHNKGKPQLARIFDFGDVIAGVVEILAFGDTKYGRYNWQKGMPAEDILNSLNRHQMAWMRGENIDPESGLLHADHIVVNALMFAYNLRHYPELVTRGIPDVVHEPFPLEELQTAPGSTRDEPPAIRKHRMFLYSKDTCPQHLFLADEDDDGKSCRRCGAERVGKPR